MSIFDKTQTAETAPKQEYKFVTSDINDFMQDNLTDRKSVV